MKSNFQKLLVLSLLTISIHASATTTLVFGLAGTNRATGFANSAGVATNGMRWGLVIDTAGDGFDNSFANTTYDSFVNSSSGFISATNGITSLTSVTDDYFWTPASLPVTSSQTATGADTGGDGGIVSAAAAPNGSDGIIPGVTTNDLFAIIWFDGSPTQGSKYGLFSDATFQIPASGTTVNRNAPFLGSGDALKTANLSFTAVPEPSRMMLLGFGLVGLFFRRRR